MPKRLVILHGYTANPTSHWFPWIEAAVPAIGEPDDELVIVGHSLGRIMALPAARDRVASAFGFSHERMSGYVST